MSNPRHHHRRRHDRQAHAAAEKAGRTPVLDHVDVVSDAPEMVDTAEALTDLLAHLKDRGSFAYDTEFIGETSYRPKVCLIQVATESRLALIDPLADLDLADFWSLLADPAIEKLVHAGEQDLEHAAVRNGVPCRSVFDTQVAAGFVELRYPMSLEDLIAETTDAELAGKLTFSQWDRRPLSDAQVRYAADDVRYLPLVADELADRLEEANMTAWCDQECDLRSVAADPDRRPPRLPKLRRMDVGQRKVLLAVTRWRETTAAALDQPVRATISDGVLKYLSRRKPTHVDHLEEVRDLADSIIKDHGQALVEAVAEAIEAPDDFAPADPAEGLPDRGEHKEAVETLWKAVRDRCEERGVSVDLVGAKKHVARHALAAQVDRTLEDDALLVGWRGELVGDLLRHPPTP
ncbi:MAG: HRDC domain-containing protein [Phycisphaeraceae bacterium]|nr:HRDC domain-containing protein [Phycisphaeraceae bacterium]